MIKKYSNVLIEHNGIALTWEGKLPVTLNYNMAYPLGWAELKASPTGDIFADMEIEDGYEVLFPGIGWRSSNPDGAFTSDGKARGEIFTVGLGVNNVDESILPIKAYCAI